jgi:hypothetical protein
VEVNAKSSFFLSSIALVFLQKLIDVLDFLKMPKTKLSSRHVKIHTKQLRDHIENWADVNTTLKETPYESFLNGRR